MVELVKREFTGRYRGSFGGLLWAVAQPLFMLAIYTVAFGVIMQARWGFTGTTKEYALMLFAGLIVYNAFAECLAKAPRLIAANPNFVKKVVFPLEVLPWVMAITALLHALIAIAVWVVGYTILYGLPHATLVYFPLVFVAFLPVLLTMGWLLAAVGVIVRDIDQLTGMLAHALLFVTPIFYSVDAAPPLIQKALLLNPLTYIVEQMRLVLFIGQPPSLLGLLVYFLLSLAFSMAALFIFRQLRSSFADNV
jgi:lipopolysaccharide transport system permease protein